MNEVKVIESQKKTTETEHTRKLDQAEFVRKIRNLLYKISDVEEVCIQYLKAVNVDKMETVVNVLELNQHNIDEMEQLLDSRE